MSKASSLLLAFLRRPTSLSARPSPKLLTGHALVFSRHLHGASGVLGTPPAIPPTPLVFNNGFFQFEINQKQYVVSYWTPIAVLPNLVYPPLPEAPPALPNQTLDGSAEVITPPQPTAKILGLQAEEVMPSAEPMALGCVLSESNSVLLEYPESGHAPVHLHLEGIVGALKTWEATEVPPKHFEAQVLEKEKEALISSYQPLSADFQTILMKAEAQANSKFKWGGLFLLSAQLGFVARLTWFEYSWDIMEPITWCLTYSMLMASFAYYILTAQEYMLPLVERRVTQNAFWKNAKKHNFDVAEFKRLRQELLTVEEKLGKTRGSGFPSFTYPF